MKKKAKKGKAKPKLKKLNSRKEFHKPVRKPRPKQPRLPGMEDAAIAPLEKMAQEYAEVRDQRMELSKEEGKLQGDLLTMMKKLDKQQYFHNGILIRVVATVEKVKVKMGASNPDDESAVVDEAEEKSEAEETEDPRENAEG